MNRDPRVGAMDTATSYELMRILFPLPEVDLVD
jgi:hypothetical protein